ncbi:MAG: radical SAM protein [Myxococcota bacterium]
MASHTARILLACNFRCPFCFAAWHEEEEGAPVPLQDELSGTQWDGYLDAMRAKGNSRLTISGGEPTMHPEILKLIRKARRAGYEAVELQTNGSLLTRENVRKLAKAGLTHALVSMHSHKPKIFDRITVTKGLFDTVVQGVKHFLEAGVIVDVSHVVLSHNVEDLEGYVQFLAREFPDLNEVHLLSMHPEARAKKNMHLWPPLQLVREVLPRMLGEAKRLGVHIRMDSLEGFPMCFAVGHEDQMDLSDIVAPSDVFGEELDAFHVIQQKKVQVPACEGCFFQRACYGFWESYFVIHGTEGIVPTPPSERLEAMYPQVTARNALPVDQLPPEAQLVPVRAPERRHIITDDDVAAIPDVWKLRREAAQDV